MKKFKTHILIFIFFISAIQISSAYAEESSRWELIGKTDKFVTYFDKTTLHIYKYKDDFFIHCWIKRVDPPSESYSLTHLYFKLDISRFMKEQFIVYKADGTVIGMQDLSSMGWSNIIPSSNLEYELKYIRDWTAFNSEQQKPIIDKTGPHE